MTSILLVKFKSTIAFKEYAYLLYLKLGPSKKNLKKERQVTFFFTKPSFFF